MVQKLSNIIHLYIPKRVIEANQHGNICDHAEALNCAGAPAITLLYSQISQINDHRAIAYSQRPRTAPLPTFAWASTT